MPDDLYIYHILLVWWPDVTPSTTPPSVNLSRGLGSEEVKSLGGSAFFVCLFCFVVWESSFCSEPVALKSTDTLLSHQLVAEYGSPFLLHRRELHPLVLWDFEKRTFPTLSCWVYLYTDVEFTDWEAFMLLPQSLCNPPTWPLTVMVTVTSLQFFLALLVSSEHFSQFFH